MTTQQMTTTMREFYGGKLSNVINGMCDGLEAMIASPKWEVDMSTYGQVGDELCFGCAATAAQMNAVCKIQGIGVEEIADAAEEFDEFSVFQLIDASKETMDDMKEFESWIDSMRTLDFDCILEYLRINPNQEVRETIEDFAGNPYNRLGGLSTPIPLRPWRTLADQLSRLGI